MSRDADRRRFLALLAGALVASACTAPKPKPDILAPTEETSKIRSYQSRTFDVADKQVALRAVMGALQDFGFIIERANESLGLVSAARFAEPNYLDIMAITVTVRPVGASQMMIRANAVQNNRPIVDAEQYQKFFAALEKSLFLTGN